MAPQDQAIRLLERTINHYEGAGAEIAKRADGWIGQVHSDPKLTSLSETAYYSTIFAFAPPLLKSSAWRPTTARLRKPWVNSFRA